MAGILKVGDVKNGYEVFKMVSGEDQGGYSITAFAKKDKFEYFLKMYQTPTVVSLPADQEFFKNRIFKLMGKLGIPKIKNFIAQDKEFFLDEESGRYIKISEILKGTQLSNLLSSEPYNNAGLSYEEAFKYATLIAYAFRNIHEFGITHSDLKPDNIFIEDRETMSGKTAKTVVIIDFDSALIDDLPKPKELVGTPGYYSVEHLVHDFMDESIWPGTDSDVFTLGIIFYELFTGQKPFLGKSAEGSLHETAMVVCNDSKLPQKLNEVNAEVPESVSNIVLSMLNPDRSARPGMKEVHEKLIKITSGEKVETKTPELSTEETQSETTTAGPAADTETSSFKDEILSAVDETEDILPTPDVTESTSEKTTPIEPPIESAPVTNQTYKLTGPAGEIALDENTGISQINSRVLGSIGVKLTKNAGRIYFDKNTGAWKLYTSKFVTGNVLKNNENIDKEKTVVLNAGDIITVDGVALSFDLQGSVIDKSALTQAEETYDDNKIKAHIEKKVGDAGDLTLECESNEIKISTVSIFILSNRNLADFELYGVKNLGSISLDQGVWKIYPSKYSEGELFLNSENIKHPTALNPGDIITIQNKNINVNF